MEFKEEFVYKGEQYRILLCEKDNLLDPETKDLVLTQNSMAERVYLYLEDYSLKLQCEREPSLSINYSGGMILVKDFIQEYGNIAEYPCYCYKKVMEFIFEEGSLITSVDHNKAMLCIRKNIEKGLRDIRKSKDYYCIQRYIQDSFVQDYSGSMKKKRWNKIVTNFRRKQKI